MQHPSKQSFKAPLRTLTVLGVFSAGQQKCDPGYTWGPGVRDHYLIHYITKGKGVLRVSGHAYPVEQGQAFLIYPGQVVAYSADAEDPWEYVWVGFAGADAGSLIAQTQFTRENPVQRMENGALLCEQILSIYNARGSDMAHTLRMTGGLYHVLAILVAQAPARRADAAAQYASAAARYIIQRYSYPITVTDVAAFVGVDRSHLYEVFMREMGMSPKTYLTRHRMDMAQKLLRETDLTVGEVASSVGYENSLYFSKVFHGVVGCAPTEYRARQQAEGEVGV